MENEVKEVAVIAPKLDIHAIKKINEALELIVTQGVEVFADGKVNVADLPHAIELLKGIPMIADACGELKEVMPELKDIDQTELAELVMSYYGMLTRIIAAYKANKNVLFL